jgi:hypothetical protein
MQTSHLIRRPAVLALMVTGALAGPAAAATVDPDTLNPPPPPGADCREDGTWIICHTGLTFDAVNAPIDDFGLPCGTIYETSNDVRRGIRWYGRADRTIVKRVVTQDVEGTWSLSPTGAGPAVSLSAHANWRALSPDTTSPTARTTAPSPCPRIRWSARRSARRSAPERGPVAAPRGKAVVRAFPRGCVQRFFLPCACSTRSVPVPELRLPVMSFALSTTL